MFSVPAGPNAREQALEYEKIIADKLRELNQLKDDLSHWHQHFHTAEAEWTYALDAGYGSLTRFEKFNKDFLPGSRVKTANQAISSQATPWL